MNLVKVKKVYNPNKHTQSRNILTNGLGGTVV
jgi:hypothetical protein